MTQQEVLQNYYRQGIKISLVQALTGELALFVNPDKHFEHADAIVEVEGSPLKISNVGLMVLESTISGLLGDTAGAEEFIGGLIYSLLNFSRN